MTNRDIAAALDTLAFFLLLRGENPYKARAYRNAGAALLKHGEEAAHLIARGTLSRVEGIGPSTAAVITDLVTTGTSAVLREVQGDYPASLKHLADVPGLSIKQIVRLYRKAGITSMAELEAACTDHRLEAIPGLGPSFPEKVRAALGRYRKAEGQHLTAKVLDDARTLARALEGLSHAKRVVWAGALRRRLEVVTELRFLVTASNEGGWSALHAQLETLPALTGVARDGPVVTARSAVGIPTTITLTTPEHEAVDQVLATGNAEHVEALAQRFRERGFADWTAVKLALRGATTEAAVYAAAGLAWVPPELREGRDEVAWAERGHMPSLLEPTALRGMFHVHTRYTDGAGTLEEMVAAAQVQGYRYIGISDHSQSAFYVNGLKEERIRAQWREIAEVQPRYPDVHIFKGIEADILPDGSLDYEDDLLAQFDFVIASVHSRFNLSEEDQTRRICRALSNRYVTMLGHPTGRLLLSRDGYRVDLDRVIDAASRHGKMLEINGNPHRLDLDWRWGQIAKRAGVRLCVNPDAHAVAELSHVAYGTDVARKAGLTPADVANTASLDDIQDDLRATRAS